MESTEQIKLKTTSVFFVVLLTAFTGGVYYPIWFLRRREEFNKLNSQTKLGKGIFIFILSLTIIILLLCGYSGFSDGINQATRGEQLSLRFNNIDLISSILTLIYIIPLVQQTFKTKRILIDHFNNSQKNNIKFSNFWTFILLNFYLQYKINKIEEMRS